MDANSSFSVSVDTRGATEVVRLVPSAVYRGLRGYFDQIAIGHREKWGRVRRIRLSDRTLREFRYEIEPQQAASTHAAAANALRNLRFEAFVTSSILAQFEKGATVRTSRFMTVPADKSGESFREWRARNPGRSLVPIRRGDKVLLFERVAGKQARRTMQDLRLRFVLTHTVRLPAGLRFLAAWDDLRTRRERQFSNACNQVIGDLNGGRRP